MIDRRRGRVVRRYLFGRSAQELACRRMPASGLSDSQARSDRSGSKRRRQPGLTTQALAAPFEPERGSEQSRQIGTRRFADRRDLIRVDSQHARVRTHPAHRRLHVLKIHRPGRFARRRQLIIGRNDHISSRHKSTCNSRAVTGLVEPPPAAAVDRDQDRSARQLMDRPTADRRQAARCRR